MSTGTKPKKYSRSVIQQAQWQMAGVTDIDDLLEVIDHPCGIYSFRNLEIYLKEEEVPLTFNDYHLLVETIVNEMPVKGTVDFDKPMPAFDTIRGVFGVMLDNCRFKKAAQAEICKQFLRTIGRFRDYSQKWKNMVQAFLDDRPNTELVYMYRCAANYKDFEEIVVSGHLALADFKDNLIDHNHMIAHQVGLASPQEHLHMDKELDHCLCELVSIEFTKAQPTSDMAAQRLKKSFNKVTWDFTEATERFGL